MLDPRDKRIAELERQLKRVTRELKLALNKIEELERRLMKYENPHTPPSKDERSKEKVKAKKHGKPGRSPGHEGTTRPQPAPDRTERVEINKCPHCDAKLGEPVKVERDIVEEIPEPQPAEVICYETLHYCCKRCGKRIVSTHPDKPKSGRFGANAQTKITLMKYNSRLPHRKVVDILENEFSFNLVPATVWNTTKSVAGHLKPSYDGIVKSLRDSPYIHIDETGFRVNGEKWWLWVFTTDEATVFALRKSRGAKVVREILGRSYKGIIISDGLKSYATYTDRRQRCWAHILRELEELAKKDVRAKALYQEVLKLYRTVTEAVGKDPPSGVRKLIHKEAKAKLEWLLAAKRRGKLGEFVKKMRVASGSLFTFVLHPGVEPTNNRAERALRENIVLRKIIGTLRNGGGAEVHEIITSMLATWKQRGENPYKVLNQLLCGQ